MKQFFAKLVSSLAVFSIVFSSFAVARATSTNVVNASAADIGTHYYNKDTSFVFDPDIKTVFESKLNDKNGVEYSMLYTGRTIVAEGSYYLVRTTVSNGFITPNFYFVIDKTAPVITIGGVADGQTYSDSRTVTYSANEGTVSATLNGVTISSGTIVYSDGSYQLVVTATDAAGNVATRTVNFTISRGNGGTNTNTNTTTTNTVTRIVKAATATAATVSTEETVATEAGVGEITVTRVENADVPAADINSCNRVRVIGTAPEGALVILYIDRDDSDIPVIGFVKAGYGDTFEFVTDTPLKDGQYTIYGKLAWEGGQTGPIVELKKFEVEKCYRLIIWLLIILVALIVALVLWLFRRRRDDEDEVREVEEYLKEVDEDETPTRL